jgi:hypothetical protein
MRWCACWIRTGTRFSRRSPLGGLIPRSAWGDRRCQATRTHRRGGAGIPSQVGIPVQTRPNNIQPGRLVPRSPARATPTSATSSTRASGSRRRSILPCTLGPTFRSVKDPVYRILRSKGPGKQSPVHAAAPGR